MSCDLLPCPFCGSGWLYETRRNGYCDETPTMFCNSCKAVVTWEQVEEEGVNDETKAFVREHWNSRVERACRFENATCYRHAKQRTIEDVLRDITNIAWTYGSIDWQDKKPQEELIAKYADELRGMGVGE